MKPVVDLAVILCAGKSERMGELTKDKPKCLMDFGGTIVGKPILYHIQDELHRQRFRFLAINAHHQPDALLDYVILMNRTDGNISQVFFEASPLGTAGAIRNMKGWIIERLLGRRDYFIVTHGDTLTTHNLQDFARKTAEKEALMGVLVHPANDELASSLLVANEENQVTYFREKPTAQEWEDIRYEKPFNRWVNAGVYCIHRDVFDSDVFSLEDAKTTFVNDDLLADGIFDFGHHVFPRLLHDEFYAFPLEGKYLTFDTPDTYESARKIFQEW